MMTNPSRNGAKSNVRSQIFELVDRMPPGMQTKLLDYLKAKLPQHITGLRPLEKRLDVRKNCLIKVSYDFRGSRHNSFILDISAFGVFIETDQPVPEGEKLSVTFRLPEEYQPFHLSGEVVWCGAHGCGIRFSDITKQQALRLQLFSEAEASVYDIIS
jgi:hypothetical protein